MTDVSDITRTRDMALSKPRQRSTHRADALSEFVMSGPDLFRTPCITGISDSLVDMFRYTMKKRKFPFTAATDDGDGEPTDKDQQQQPDDVEQTRRFSNTSVRAYAPACVVV